ncbi:MAG: elongation factor Ts [Rivularia sp. ALOHA_DT_140]|nr:elongation factor Ts [Rivularia sp. ALOHA_DT_140]
MVNINAKVVQRLRQKTGVGMMDCKKALQASNGDVEAAITWLRKRSQAVSLNNEKITAEGIISSYVHTGGKVAVLLEVNCETDFVSKTEVFHILVKDIAMQIAAYSNINYVNVEDIPQEIIDTEKAIEIERDDLANKPDNIKEKIVKGRIEKRLKEMTLMNQPFIRNPKSTVEEQVKQTISVVGENIKVRRFVRFVLGEKIDS